MSDGTLDPPAKVVTEEESLSSRPLDNPENAFEFVVCKLKADKLDDDWKDQEKLLQYVIALAKFHSAVLVRISEKELFPTLREYAESLRSAVAKTALVALSEVFRNCSELIERIIDFDPAIEKESELRRIISSLSSKCVCEKKFLADAAQEALTNLSSAVLISKVARKAIFSELLLSATASKNIRLTGLLTTYALTCCKSNSDFLHLFEDPAKPISLVLDLESGKSTAAKTPAQALLREMKMIWGDSGIAKALDELNLNSSVRKRIEDILKNEKPVKTSSSGSTGGAKPWQVRDIKATSST
jgi:hypothetical protein